MKLSERWQQAFEMLVRAGVAKRNIRSYCLCADTTAAYHATPEIAWQTCEFIESHKIKALPQWFHDLDALDRNKVTDKQAALGWTDYERRKLMQWYYQHKRAAA